MISPYNFWWLGKIYAVRLIDEWDERRARYVARSRVVSPRMSGYVKVVNEIPPEVQRAAEKYREDGGIAGLTLNEYLSKLGFNPGDLPTWWT